MANAAFKVGDVVQLKSGSPNMTVTQVGNQIDPDAIYTAWFVGNKKDSDTFPAGALQIPPTDDLGFVV